MKNILVFIVLSFNAYLVFAQEKKETELLISDASWAKEIIQMPIHFAPQIPYKGKEEIRFSPDWSKQKSDGFWTYAFVWDIDLDAELRATDLETYLQYYFDGLMNVVNKDKDKIVPKTVALFLKKETTTKAIEFVGKLQIYNSFHTKDVMLLHCTVKQYYCKSQEKSKVLFYFSPKELDHAIWDELYKIQLMEKPCED